ncbi:MAG: alpha/beta hydrolase [Planctomycetota bacterium]|nr:alpha/beta hydrolase [Planctomycetota bacterium]
MHGSQAKVAGDSGPHAGQPVLSGGPSPEKADVALILLHGRGASAEGMLSLYEVLSMPNVAAIVPQAAGNSWYPHSFLVPLKDNQPYLDSALATVDGLVSDLLARGIPSNRIALLGFSQGACLTTEFVARHPRRYGAVIGFTGGLIGPAGTPRNYAGSLAGTPVFLGSSDPDPHVPFERVKETEAVLSRMGASVELRRFGGMPHTINEEELEAARTLLRLIAAPAAGDKA